LPRPRRTSPGPTGAERAPHERATAAPSRLERRQHILAAARNVFDSRNLTSLRAVWEQRKWIGGL